MAIFLQGVGRKVKSIFVNVDGEMKNVISAWTDKGDDPEPVTVFNTVPQLEPRLMAVGNEQTSYTLDGTTWKSMKGSSGSDYLLSVTYGNNRFVCVGRYGVSYYSTDGTTWNAMTGLSSSYHYKSVAYGNKRFVCVGENGAYYSTDGLTWNKMKGLASSFSGDSVAYGNGIFVCVGSPSGLV